MFNNRIGVGIISWDRPQYLEQLINTLEKNDLHNTEFHLFQDGAVCKFTDVELTNPHNILKSIKVFHSSSLPNKHLHLQDKNVSVAINQFEAMGVLCQNYEHFIFLENDVVLSPNFVTLAKKILKQFEKDKRVACVSPGFKLLCKKDVIEKNLDRLIFKRGHFWTEICWSEKWKKIEKAYLPYYDIVKDVAYRERSSNMINNLFEKSGYKMLATSQDNGKDWAISMAEMRRVRMVVNRATGIGDYGIHSTPEKLKQHRDGHNKIYSSKEELDIKEFRL